MKLINADQLTPEQRRERARLRSERWRRAHGIPRAAPQRARGWPWPYRGRLYYRRRAKAREQAALAQATAARGGRARPATVAGGGAARQPRSMRGLAGDHGATIHKAWIIV
jgi:hypothetical protein